MSAADYNAIQITLSVCNFQKLTEVLREEMRHRVEMIMIEDDFDANRNEAKQLHELVDLVANIGLYEKEVKQ